MGQKLEKLSEKNEESPDHSDWSEPTGETEHLETAEQDESRDPDNATPQSIGGISEISVSGLATGQPGGLTVTSAHTDPQTGQPIRPLGPLNTMGEWVGGDRESWSVTQTVESKTVLSPTETRQTSNKKQGSDSRVVARVQTSAMEEQGHRKKSGPGRCTIDPDTQTRSLTASWDPANEEDFVVLERDETWMSSDREDNMPLGKRIKTDHLQSSIKSRVEDDASASHSDNNRPQSSREDPQEKGNERKSRRKPDTLSVTTGTGSVEAHARSFDREMGQHLAEVTGSRCRLKGVSHVGAANTEPTRRGKAAREETMNDHSKGQVSININKEHLSTQKNGGLVKSVRKSADDWEPCSEKVALSLRESENQDKESPNSGLAAQVPQVGADQSHQSRFAGAVSKRAKAGHLSLCTRKEDSEVFCKAADCHPTKLAGSEILPLQDNPSFSLEQIDLIPLPRNEDGKIQIASLKGESELVCFSAVISPPPVTHLLPQRDASVATQLCTSTANSQIAPDAIPTSCDSVDESMPKEKPKVKGPPPPVPKKPKNPFIRLKTAQLMSTGVQRRCKDPLRSEERVKRRHTFDFNKILPCNVPTNQDMCLLWDEKGTYMVPSNMRPLSVDLSPWEHLSLGRMDDQYGDMIDYDYCARMGKLSPEEELQNLDMLQRRVFLERLSRFKRSPPPVARKPPNPFASTETLHMSEVTPDNEIQRPKPACSGKRGICPEFRSERVSTQVCNDNRGSYGNRKDIPDDCCDRDAGNGSEVGSYKPVAEIIKETNQMQRHQGRVKPEEAKAPVWVAEQSPSVKVSQMKNAFDVPKKSRERPAEVQPSPKKGKVSGLLKLKTPALSVLE